MKTKVLKIAGGEDFSAVVAEGAAVLAGGGLVVFPTETVYGIGANAAQPEALERLAKLKERPDEKPFTLHIGCKEQLQKYVPKLSAVQRHFVRKALPGPVTFVFELDEKQQTEVQKGLNEDLIGSLYYQNSLGLRWPAHPVAEALLQAVDAPVVAPSANLAGKQPARDADEALTGLDGQVDLVIDAGPTRYSQASTVVRLGASGFEVLRAGVVDKGVLERMYGVRVLFVCTGNTCRSPMAEGIYKHLLAEKVECRLDDLPKKGYHVASAGVMAGDGFLASSEAIEACREDGIDIGSHQSRALRVDEVNQADYVFAMSRSHYDAMVSMCPQAQDRIALLDPSGGDIADPIGMPLEIYRQCKRQIGELVRQRLNELPG